MSFRTVKNLNKYKKLYLLKFYDNFDKLVNINKLKNFKNNYKLYYKNWKSLLEGRRILKNNKKYKKHNLKILLKNNLSRKDLDYFLNISNKVYLINKKKQGVFKYLALARKSPWWIRERIIFSELKNINMSRFDYYVSLLNLNLNHYGLENEEFNKNFIKFLLYKLKYKKDFIWYLKNYNINLKNDLNSILKDFKWNNKFWINFFNMYNVDLKDFKNLNFKNLEWKWNIFYYLNFNKKARQLFSLKKDGMNVYSLRKYNRFVKNDTMDMFSDSLLLNNFGHLGSTENYLVDFFLKKYNIYDNNFKLKYNSKNLKILNWLRKFILYNQNNLINKYKYNNKL